MRLRIELAEGAVSRCDRASAYQVTGATVSSGTLTLGLRRPVRALATAQ